MSGLARAAKKHWKRVIKTVKKYWKVVAIAVAAYFTFGLALGAMAPAAGTVAAGTGAAATGTGVMTATGAAAGSTAAAATGAAAATAGIETVTVSAAAGGGLSAAGAGAIGAAAAGGAVAASSGGGGAAGEPTGQAPSQEPVKPAQPAQPAVQSTQPSKLGILDKAKAGWKEMSFSDKLLLAKAGVDVVAATTAPSPEEEAAAARKWQGAFYGRTESEADQFMKSGGGGTQFVNQQTAPQPIPANVGGKVAQRDIVDGGMGMQAVQPTAPAQRMQFESNNQPTATAPPATPQKVTDVGDNRDLFAQRAPGVRYLV
jgi:hypothetical protein